MNMAAKMFDGAMRVSVAGAGRRAAAVAPAKRAVSVQRILEWAFRDECAPLHLDSPVEPEGHRPGISTIWVMMQRGNLGCQIDGGGRSDPHEDAEVVAAIVAGLPDAHGGFRMAVQIAELSRAGMVPDAMVGSVPRLHPQGVVINRHGVRGKPADSVGLGDAGWRAAARCNRRGVLVVEPVLYTPCHWHPTADVIASARRRYLGWWGALHDLRSSLQGCGLLRRHTVTSVMPPMKPWDETS